MTGTGLAGAPLAELVAAVRPGGPDADPAAVFAAGAWTAVVEPGESTAGALIGALGAHDALESLLLDAPPSQRPELGDAYRRWRVRARPDLLLAAFRNAAVIGARLVVPGDPDWPGGLADLGPHAPLALWALAPDGPLPPLARSVAVVGTRDPTPYGVQAAQDIVCGLADRGFAVVSGGAAGIDRAGHRAALASAATTAAVLAGGPDRLYPQANAELLHRIAREGVVLSEMACGSSPMKQRFLSRNRLIAAITRVTVVVEAGVPSGAINTAAHAGELGRPVAVVPGSVYSAASAGCHRLLRDYDAVLVRGAADVAELARDPDTAVALEGLDLPLDPLEQRVLQALGRRPAAVPDVAARAGLERSEAAAVLALLALAGAAADSPRGWVRA